MVPRPPKRRSLKIALVCLAFVAGIATSVLFAYYFRDDREQFAPQPQQETTTTPDDTPSQDTSPSIIDLQPVLDEWLSTLGATTDTGVEIYDLDNEQIVAAHNADSTFPTESLYKLFVAYEGYRRLEQETQSPTATIGGHTYAQCLDLAIRESNSACAEAIRADIGAQTLENIIQTDYGLSGSSSIDLTSTASDITDMLKIYYNHPDLTADTWATIQDSMLNQPPVNNGLCYGPCDWRQGLPSGFEVATVYDKVGWRYQGNNIWQSYHDAAIIEFPAQKRHYIVTILTSNSKYQDLSRFGTMLEAAILDKTNSNTQESKD